MSTSSSVSGISFSGLASGVDTNSIISKLVQLDQQPITQLQSQEATIQVSQAAIQQLQANLQAVSSAAGALAYPSNFQQTIASSSNTSVATISANSGNLSGSYNLSVTQLASAQKLGSAAQSSTSSALNLRGVFVVNGKSVSVQAGDTLTSIAQKINGLGVGVGASLIDGGSGNAYITLTSSATGAANAVQLSDVSGGVLGGLGLLSGTSSVRQSVTNGAASYGLSSSTQPIGTLLGLPSDVSGPFSINGVSVSVDLGTDGLQSVADKINAASTGASASVVQVAGANGAANTYQLQITGASGTPTFSDPNGILGTVGVLQQGAGNQLVAAQDAKYSLDNVNLTSASNTITSAIPGATLTLLQGTTATPGTSVLSLQPDVQGLDSKVTAFVSAYNAVVDYISQNSQLNTSNYQSGPLFGDFTTQQVQSELTNGLFSNITGLSGTYTNLASLGFSLDQSTNHLTFNQSTFNQAYANNPSAVTAVFAATGSSSNTSLNYISAGSKTVTSAGYSVNITQAATQSTYTAETAQTSPLATSENLTFSGALFGSSPYTLTLDANSTQAQIISKINNDATLSGLVTASSVNGSLQLISKHYGSATGFTVTSTVASGSNNSGIGSDGLGASVKGSDVAGTINGETATGTGQYLTGNSGNTNTDGLQVQYTGTTTGAVGSVSYSQGVGSLFGKLITQMNDPATGLITSDLQSYTNQITDITTQITSLQTLVSQKQTQLQQEFANMEASIAQYQQQGQSLTAIFGSSTSSSTSSSTAKIG